MRRFNVEEETVELTEEQWQILVDRFDPEAKSEPTEYTAGDYREVNKPCICDLYERCTGCPLNKDIPEGEHATENERRCRWILGTLGLSPYALFLGATRIRWQLTNEDRAYREREAIYKALLSLEKI